MINGNKLSCEEEHFKSIVFVFIISFANNPCFRAAPTPQCRSPSPNVACLTTPYPCIFACLTTPRLILLA